jgi:hypothetical protein
MTLEEIKSRINPAYQDVPGTESYERKWLCYEVERLSALCDKWNQECDELREDNKRQDIELASLKAQSSEPVAWIPNDAIEKLRSGEPKIVLTGVPCYKYDGENTTPVYTAAPRDDTETLRRDAERYRWLIQQHWVQSEIEFRLGLDDLICIDDYGPAIDAAKGE